jgi:hypothetical protein
LVVKIASGKNNFNTLCKVKKFNKNKNHFMRKISKCPITLQLNPKTKFRKRPSSLPKKRLQACKKMVGVLKKMKNP